MERLWINIGIALESWLGTFLPSWAVLLVMDLFYAILLVLIGVFAVLALSFMERKVAARVGDRYGPNRWGPYGLFQPFADAIKMLIKEDVIPSAADRFAFNLAPVIITMGAVLTYAVLPFGKGMIAADLNIGVLYFAAVGSLSVLGLMTAGWGSRNKYSLVSAFRAVAQIITYEVPLALCMISVVMLTGSLSTQDIIMAQQQRGWFFLLMPGIFVIYFMAASAEMIRCPFDLLEADSEIVAGHFVEYSGMKFALFFLAEYIHLFAGSAMVVTLFFGGWLGPWLPSWLWFFIKTAMVIFVFMWVRNTFPRIRIDQILSVSWKMMVPAGLVGIVITGFVDKLVSDKVVAGVLLFACNILLLVGISYFMGRAQRRKEMAAEGAALR